MINKLTKEFKHIIWPQKKKVIEDFGIVLVIATFLMVVVLAMDNGTQYVFEKVASLFL